MKVIIPAAGYGCRLRPHTFIMPKVLLPVAGKPILEHIISQVVYDVDQVVIIYGHLGDQIQDFVKQKRYKLNFSFCHQEFPDGLGHAIYIGLDKNDKEVLVILGDTIYEADLTQVIKRGRTAIGVKKVDNPSEFGVVSVDNGRVTRLVEKALDPPSNLAIVGVYYIRDGGKLRCALKQIMDKKITVKGQYQMTDALQLLLEWGEPIETFPVNSWFDCGKPETLLATNEYLLKREGGYNNDITKEEAVFVQPVYIGDGTTIKRSVIGPNVSIGQNCQIEETIIKNSIIGEKTIIKKALLSDTIIGNRTELTGRLYQINMGSSSLVKL